MERCRGAAALSVWLLAQAMAAEPPTSEEPVDTEDQGSFATFVVSLGLMLIFFSFWNGFCAALCGGAWVLIFQGSMMEGLCCLALCCCIPHVFVGFWLPYFLFHFPVCLVFYWPHYVAIWGACQETRRAAGQVPTSSRSPASTQASAQRLVRQVAQQHSRPVAVVQRAFSEPKYPERYRIAKENLAQDHGECGICFEGLCTKPVVVLLSSATRGPPHATTCSPEVLGSRRVCRHYFHLECIAQLQQGLQSSRCPFCRASYRSVRQLPEVSTAAGRENEQWFYLASLGKPWLGPEDLEAALLAVLPLSHAEIGSKARALCGVRGSLSLSNFKEEVPKYIVAVLSGTKPASRTTVPLAMTRRELFHILDNDRSGRVDCAKMVRGLSKLPTLKALCTRAQIEAGVYHTYRHFHIRDGVGVQEFCQDGGLLDEVCMELQVSSAEILLAKSSLGQPLLELTV